MYIILDSEGNFTVCRDKNAAFKAMYNMKEDDVIPIQTTWIQEGSFKLYPKIEHSNGVDVSDSMQTEMN